MADNLEPTAKRRKTEPKLCLHKLPADKFLSNIELFEGDRVIVVVGGEEFKLPKALLCYHSTFFNAAFNGRFKEAAEKKLVLASEHTVQTFGLVVQWIYTGNIVLPATKASVAPVNEKICLEKNREMAHDTTGDAKGSSVVVEHQAILNPLETAARSAEVTEYLAFLTLADEIDLLGPFEIITSAIKSAFRSQPLSLLGSHIRTVANFPQRHPVRKLIAETCVGDYIAVTMAKIDPQGSHKPKFEFKFSKELEEIESFSSDLFREYRSCLASRFKRDGKHYVKDPQHRRLIEITL